MRGSLFLLTVSMAILGCTEEPYDCNCNTSFVKENDSIIQSARLDSSIIKLDKRYNQELLEKRDKETYRIYISHSLNKYFQVYTLVKSNSGGTLKVQEYQGSTLDNRLDTSYSIDLTKNEWSDIKKSINSNCFWTIRFNDGKNHEKLDGGEIILEGYQPDKRNCANSDYYMIIDWASGDKRVYQILKDIRKYIIQKNSYKRNINERN